MLKGNQMINSIKMELRKALKNKFFNISLGVMTLFAVLSAVWCCQNFLGLLSAFEENYFSNGKMIENDLFPVYTSYNYWIGGEMQSLMYSLFFTLLPVFAVLPFGWSYYLERKSGYIKQVVTKTGKRTFFLAKLIAVFISGALVVFIPLIINFLIVSAVYPSTLPQVNYVFYNYVGFGSMWSDLFFTIPWLYVALYILLDSLFAGLFAISAFAVSFFVKNRVAVVFFPFVFCMALEYLRTFLISSSMGSYPWDIEIAPTAFLHAAGMHCRTIGYVVLLEAVFIAIFAGGTILIRGKKDEIF